MTQIVAFWRKLPTALRSAWITAWVTFVASLFAIATSLLPKLAEAFTSRNFDPFYDSLGAQANVAVSAALALVAGIINGVFRWVKPIEEAYRKDVPADA
jgi:hypothetical protein